MRYRLNQYSSIPSATMAERVALSVQASQDQQNNNVKHLEAVFLFVYFKLYVFFEWSPSVPLKNYAQATPGKC